MPQIDEIHVDDIGTVFEFTFRNGSDVDNISTATSLSVKFKKPSGATSTKPLTLTSDGSDGKAQYTTIAGDLDEEGGWQAQGYAAFPDGAWRTNKRKFNVEGNL